MENHHKADQFFDDHRQIRRWIDRIGGIDDAATSLKIDKRTMQRFYSGAMKVRLSLAREMAGIVGEKELIK